MLLLKRDFFARPTLAVARALLGQHLVRQPEAGARLVGRIVETEAYIGPEDTACHASKGRTARTEVMFGPGGHAYVYLIYGMYHMLNLTTEQPEFPAAVLIRAVEPVAGQAAMEARRPRARRPVNLTNGPGKLAQALAIDRELNGWDLTRGERLWLAPAPAVPDEAVVRGPRVGIDYAAPADRSAPWRFWVADNPFVSKR